MSQDPQINWKQPLTGGRKWLAWFVLFAVILFVMVCVRALVSDIRGQIAETIVVASLIAVFGSVLALSAMRFARWVCCWRNFRRFLFGIACFATLIALFYAEENWRGKLAWENHKRACAAKGEKFAVAELAPRPVPDEQNFALTPLLKPALDYARVNGHVVWRDTNAYAHLQSIGVEQGAGSTGTNRLALGSLEKGTLANIEACREFYRGNTNYPQPATSGTAAEDILTAVGKFDPDLKELREASVTRPLARFPIEYDFEPSWGILLPHLAHLKGLTVLTEVRATAELEAGRPADAFADLMLGFRLSDVVRDEPFLIDHLVRVATLGINLQVVREGLARHAWTDAQLTELENYLAPVDLLAEYKLGMRGERALAASGLDYLRRQRFQVNAMDYIGNDEGGGESTDYFSRIPGGLMPSGWFYQNMLTISKMHEDFTLAAVDEKSRQVFPDLCEKLDSTLEKMPTRSYNIFARMLMPALAKAIRRSARMQTYVDATRVACAIERNRLARNTLPDTLDALTPRFIGKIPNDVIDGKPLRYHRNSDGGYILYSVGWNHADDGGELAWKTDKERSVDIAKGDWVWFYPAK